MLISAASDAIRMDRLSGLAAQHDHVGRASRSPHHAGPGVGVTPLGHPVAVGGAAQPPAQGLFRVESSFGLRSYAGQI